MEDTQRTHCIRCGECCISSSPTLQREDLPLILEGVLRRSDLFTIRRGEFVLDNIRGNLTASETEMIKIREVKGGKGGCIFYRPGENACAIYDRRPVQCAALKCWDTDEFMDLYRGPKLRRQDILSDGILLELILEHENRCGYGLLDSLVRRIETHGEDAIEKVLEILRFDYRWRPFISEKLDIDPSDMEFLFGRPLIDTLSGFGLQVIRQPDGSFFLTTLE